MCLWLFLIFLTAVSCESRVLAPGCPRIAARQAQGLGRWAGLLADVLAGAGEIRGASTVRRRWTATHHSVFRYNHQPHPASVAWMDSAR